MEGKGILEDNEKAVQLWQPPLRKIIELELESSLINRKTMEVKEIV